MENDLYRRHTDGQQAHEKMLNIANYQRNTNQNYSEVPPHTSQKCLQIVSKKVQNNAIRSHMEATRDQ